jgi:putative molybdopterin biosynthesis protein
VSPAGDDDYVRVAVARVGERLVAAPLSRGAGVITSLVQADGIALLPRGVQGIGAGEAVSVALYRPRAELDRTIFCTGSHDLTLDLLAQAVAADGRRLLVSNVGSQGGLLALSRRQAHFAGSHLFDPKTAEYNVPFLKVYLPGIPVRVIALLWREQGLLVPAGNPLELRSLQDLTRREVRYINRQRGAGTRVLLDYHLATLGIDGGQIQGYEHEEYTHLAVAASVAGGRADAGLGIAAAAEALGLDFVPLFRERYDLVVPLEHADGELLSPVFQALGKPEYRHAVANLRGYDAADMGAVVYED